MSQSVIRQAIIFFKNPSMGYYNQPIKSKLWSIFQLWSLQSVLIIFAGFVSVLTLSLSSWTGISLVESQANTSILAFFILAVVIAPTLEELAFRGWITSGRYIFSLALGVLFYLLYNVFPRVDIFNSLIFDIFHGLFIAFGIFLPIYSFVLLKNKLNQLKLKHLLHKNIAILVYSSSIVFALIHLGNFTHLEEIWFLAPLIILPQLIGGFSLAYIRIKFGLFYSILVHTITNLVPFLLLLGSGFLSPGIKDLYADGSLSSKIKLTSGDQFIVYLLGIFMLLYFLIISSVSIYSIVKYYKSK